MLPNFMCVGASKAGSSWVQLFCERHPEIFVPASKDTYFFSDYFHKGVDWYEAFFRGAETFKARGEVCHDYFVSELAMSRIFAVCGPIKILLFARNPFDRARSSFKYLKRNGYKGSFSEAIAEYPIIIDEGYYSTALSNIYKLFPEEAVHVFVFDDLVEAPRQVAMSLCDALGVNFHEEALPAGAVNSATAPRNRHLAHLAWSVGKIVRRAGGGQIVGYIKRLGFTRRTLYQAWDPAALRKIDSEIEFPKDVSDRYQAEAIAFGQQIGRDLSHWRE